MVHNGIEYADMQLIAEAYGYMRDALKFNNEKIHRIFSNWSRGELAGYLLDITSDIFTFKDPESGALLLPLPLPCRAEDDTRVLRALLIVGRHGELGRRQAPLLERLRQERALELRESYAHLGGELRVAVVDEAVEIA